MPKTIAVIGASGTFGKRIVQQLNSSSKNFTVLECSRNGQVPLDVNDVRSVEKVISDFKVDLVIDSAGPFQNRTTELGKAVVNTSTHFIDLSDNYEFSQGLLDAVGHSAESNGVHCVTGTSTFPTVTSTLINSVKDEFSEIHGIENNLSPGVGIDRGSATIQSILCDIGKQMPVFDEGEWKEVMIGKMKSWRPQIMHGAVNKRFLSNTDLPDNYLFPERYGVKRSVRSFSGIDVGIAQLGFSAIAEMKNRGIFNEIPLNPIKWMTEGVARISTTDSAHQTLVTGLDKNGEPHVVSFNVVGLDGEGPHFAASPSAIIAEKILSGECQQKPSARFALDGEFSVDELMDQIKEYRVELFRDGIVNDEHDNSFERGIGKHGFDGLPSFFRQFHSPKGGIVNGMFDILKPPAPLNYLTRVKGLPKEESNAETMVVSRNGHWIRLFGAQSPMASEWGTKNGVACESFFPFQFGFVLIPMRNESGEVIGFEHVARGMWFLGLRLPQSISLTPDGESWMEGDDKERDGWHVNVSLQAPILGELMRYKGKVWKRQD